MAESLNVLDNLFFQLESPTTPMHVGGLLIFDDGGLDPDGQLAAMRRAPVRAKPFDRKVRFSSRRGALPTWDRVDDVDLSQHVDTCDAPSPGSDEALMSLVSELHTAPVDRGRPLWQCRLIRGLSDGRFALYYKVHHACIDGVTGIRRIQGALSLGADDATEPVWAIERTRTPRPKPPAAPLASKARMLPEVLRAMASVGLGAARRHQHRTSPPYICPNTPLNPMVSGERSVAWCSLPLEGMREVGAAVGATVNDVALALCAAILRERLLAMNALPRRPLVAMVPFSLRDAGNPGASGNDVSCILCNLATHIDDPVERLRVISASASDGKRMLRSMSAAAAAAYWLAVGGPAIMAQMAGLSRRFPLPFNVVVSNVPGPKERLYHNGAELQAIYPASLLFERQALNITLVSYRDRVDFGLLGCRRTIPDLPYLSTRIGAAYDELASALGF